MFSLSGLRAIAGVVGPLVLTLVAFNILLGVLFGPSPLALQRAQLLNPDQRSLIAARVRAVKAVRPLAPVARDKLYMLIGFSTAREGIDPHTFEKAAGQGTRLLNLASSGGSFDELNWYYRAVLDRKLDVDTLILGIHPVWLAGRRFGRAELPLESWTLGWPAIRAGAKHRIWIFENRPGMHFILTAPLYGLRDAMHEAIGLVAFQSDPWTPRIMYAEARASDAVLSTQLRQWQRLGWFDPMQYGPETDETQTLGRLIGLAHIVAPRLVIVLMPESETLRSLEPPQAYRTLMEVVKRAAPGTRILDFRGALPDEMFYDHVHLNAEGRATLSRGLGGQLVRSE